MVTLQVFLLTQEQKSLSVHIACHYLFSPLLCFELNLTSYSNYYPRRSLSFLYLQQQKSYLLSIYCIKQALGQWLCAFWHDKRLKDFSYLLDGSYHFCISPSALKKPSFLLEHQSMCFFFFLGRQSYKLFVAWLICQRVWRVTCFSLLSEKGPALEFLRGLKLQP